MKAMKNISVILLVILICLLSGCETFPQDSIATQKPDPVIIPVITNKTWQQLVSPTVDWIQKNTISEKAQISLLDLETGVIRVSDSVTVNKPINIYSQAVIVTDGSGDSIASFVLEIQIKDGKTLFIFHFDAMPFDDNYIYNNFCYDYAEGYYNEIKPLILKSMATKDGAVKSIDGKYTIYIPNGNNQDVLYKNKALISYIVSQALDNPITLSFAVTGEECQKFWSWMEGSYKDLYDLMTGYQVYYQTGNEDNNALIEVNNGSPGLNILVKLPWN